MGALGGIFLCCGLFFLYKTFTAPNIWGHSKRLQLFGESAGKIDCGMAAAVMFFGAFLFLFNM
ncbi:MAG: hypothetical protein OSJ43_11095 [Oscillospiraceae bacterium]|nr:hypothetical protein [Oscillospiraceae bacterium]